MAGQKPSPDQQAIIDNKTENNGDDRADSGKPSDRTRPADREELNELEYTVECHDDTDDKSKRRYDAHNRARSRGKERADTDQDDRQHQLRHRQLSPVSAPQQTCDQGNNTADKHQYTEQNKDDLCDLLAVDDQQYSDDQLKDQHDDGGYQIFKFSHFILPKE